MNTDDNLKRQAYEKLEQLAALSGWRSAIEALDATILIDTGLQRLGESTH